VLNIILKYIDRLNLFFGSVMEWLVPVLILQMTFEIIARYFFKSPTIWGYQTSLNLNATIIMLSWGWCQLKKSHVRIDIIYSKLKPKIRLVIDLVGTIVFFFPLILGLIKTGFEWTLRAWITREVMTETIWYPLSGPIRTIFLVGFFLVFLQFLAQSIRDFNEIRGGAPL
jgi:TRAP-type mannitol/chloroaromatic compound transport system permease small subunit